MADSQQETAYTKWRSAYPLHALCQLGNHGEITTISDYMDRLNTPDNEKWLPIHYAAFEGHCDTIKWLVEQGANPNAGNHFGSTPLHLAIGMGRVDVVQFLLSILQSREEILTRNEDKQSPLDLVSYVDPPLDKQLAQLITDRLQELSP